jgi:restriction endonuclease S subunit
MAGRSALLNEIATVHTVSLFRDRPPGYTDAGNTAILTIKDLTGKWPIDFKKLPKAQVDHECLSQAIKQGDILMPARGDHYPARYIVNSEGVTIFPAGQIHVISSLKDTCSGFLAWYMNLPDVQTSIHSLLTGTSIQSLNKTRLLTLRLRIPPEEIQLEISQLQEKQIRRVAMMHELINLQDREVEVGCLKLLKRGI